jgi:shikimate 5-dehydrogenase
MYMRRFDISNLVVLTDDSCTMQVIISTIPADANFSLPAGLLKTRPVVLDAVYKPARTPLLTQVTFRLLRVYCQGARGMNNA